MKIGWRKVAKILKTEGVVVIPSDSSYGIAALANNHRAVAKLYRIKKREAVKPSLIIVGSLKQANQLAKFNPLAKSLAKKYWPGGLTLVLQARSQNFSPLIYGQGGSLAMRWPKKPELVWLAKKIGPFVLPSANFATEKAPYFFSEINPQLKDLVDLVLDEPTDGSPVSTLVDLRGKEIKILREGAIKLEFIQDLTD